MNPKVSVLVPVFNVCNFIEESINSLIKQDYENLEILIYNDGSTDDTTLVLDQIEDHRVIIYSSVQNRGIVYALNFLLSICTGDYILRHDGDDYCEIDRVSRKIKYLQENSIDIVGCSTKTVNSKGEYISERMVRVPSTSQLAFARLESPISHIWMCNRQVYLEVGGYSADLQGVEDYDWLLRAISLGKSIGVLSDYYGYTIRVNRSGNTQDLYGKRRYMLFEEAKRRSFTREKISKTKNNYIFIKAEETIHQFLQKRSVLNLLRVVIRISFSKYHINWVFRRMKKAFYA